MNCGQIDFAGLHGGDSHLIFLQESVGRLGEGMGAACGVGIGKAPPVGVGFIGDRLAFAPLDKLVRTGADDISMVGVRILGQLLGRRDAYPLDLTEQDRVRLRCRHVQRVFIYGGCAHCAEEIEQVEGVVCVESMVDAGGGCFGVEGRAIVEGHALPKSEAYLGIVHPFPGGCQQWHEFTGGEITVDQLFEGVTEARPAGSGEGAPSIQADRLDANGDDHFFACHTIVRCRWL